MGQRLGVPRRRRVGLSLGLGEAGEIGPRPMLNGKPSDRPAGFQNLGSNPRPFRQRVATVPMSTPVAIRPGEALEGDASSCFPAEAPSAEARAARSPAAMTSRLAASASAGEPGTIEARARNGASRSSHFGVASTSRSRRASPSTSSASKGVGSSEVESASSATGASALKAPAGSPSPASDSASSPLDEVGPTGAIPLLGFDRPTSPPVATSDGETAAPHPPNEEVAGEAGVEADGVTIAEGPDSATATVGLVSDVPIAADWPTPDVRSSSQFDVYRLVAHGRRLDLILGRLQRQREGLERPRRPRVDARRSRRPRRLERQTVADVTDLEQVMAGHLRVEREGDRAVRGDRRGHLDPLERRALGDLAEFHHQVQPARDPGRQQAPRLQPLEPGKRDARSLWIAIHGLAPRDELGGFCRLPNLTLGQASRACPRCFQNRPIRAARPAMLRKRIIRAAPARIIQRSFRVPPNPPPQPSPARGEGARKYGDSLASGSLPPCGGGLGWGGSSNHQRPWNDHVDSARFVASRA